MPLELSCVRTWPRLTTHEITFTLGRRLGSAFALIKLGPEPKHLFRIPFNGRMKEEFVPLFFQSRAQHFPSDPRRR